MKDPISFSVIIPVYNGSLFLEDAIKSVLSQIYRNWELIIVDDGSNDKSLEIANSYVSKYDKIRVFQHDGGENKGVSSSRNLAISKSNGNWISLLDADDTWLPEKLDREAQIILAHPKVIFLYSKAKRVYEAGFPESSETPLYGVGKNGEIILPFIKLLSGIIVSTSAVSFNKEIFLKCGGFDQTMKFSEDTLLFHQLMEFGNVFCLEDVLSTHRLHSLSVVSNTSQEIRIISRFIVYEKLILRVRKENVKLVSEVLVNTGLLKIFRNYIIYPANRFDIVIKYLIRILNNSNVLLRHKIKAIIMLFTEIFMVPIKIIWLNFKSVNNNILI